MGGGHAERCPEPFRARPARALVRYLLPAYHPGACRSVAVRATCGRRPDATRCEGRSDAKMSARRPETTAPRRIDRLATLPLFHKLEGRKVVLAGASEGALW